MDYNINDKVVIVDYNEIPYEKQNKAIAKACGKVGTIKDKLYSESQGEYIYKIFLEGSKSVSQINFTEDMFEPCGGGMTTSKLKQLSKKTSSLFECTKAEKKSDTTTLTSSTKDLPGLHKQSLTQRKGSTSPSTKTKNDMEVKDE